MEVGVVVRSSDVHTIDWEIFMLKFCANVQCTRIFCKILCVYGTKSQVQARIPDSSVDESMEEFEFKKACCFNL